MYVQWKSRDECPYHLVRVSPPATEDLLATITDMQGTPPIGINVSHRNKGDVLLRLAGVRRKSIDEADIHAGGVEPKTYVQRFEGAFFRTPQQSYQQRPFLIECSLNECLLVGREVIGDEGIAARLDDFQITADARPGQRDGTHGDTGTVAE